MFEKKKIFFSVINYICVCVCVRVCLLLTFNEIIYIPNGNDEITNNQSFFFSSFFSYLPSTIIDGSVTGYLSPMSVM